jgi:hypothetical protein
VIQWLIALGLVLAFLATMPLLLRWVKTSGGKGRMGGVALALGVAFSFLFDPAKAEAMENIADRKARREEAGQGETVE